jgi:hypothetical protein
MLYQVVLLYEISSCLLRLGQDRLGYVKFCQVISGYVYFRLGHVSSGYVGLFLDSSD